MCAFVRVTEQAGRFVRRLESLRSFVFTICPKHVGRTFNARTAMNAMTYSFYDDRFCNNQNLGRRLRVGFAVQLSETRLLTKIIRMIDTIFWNLSPNNVFRASRSRFYGNRITITKQHKTPSSVLVRTVLNVRTTRVSQHRRDSFTNQNYDFFILF